MCRNPFHKSLITIQQSSIERPIKLFIFPFAPPPPPPSCGDPLCGEVCGVGEVSTSSFHFDNLETNHFLSTLISFRKIIKDIFCLLLLLMLLQICEATDYKCIGSPCCLTHRCIEGVLFVAIFSF